MSFTEEQTRMYPHKPGVYIFKNANKDVIYVGKAVDLKSRISSYFSKNRQGLKTTKLVKEIKFVETIIVESELEALILEANLIKKYLPVFNVRLTDDKDYLYIKVTKEDFPKIITARKQDLPAGRQGIKDAHKYFGPFPSSTTVKKTLRSLRKIFPWCSNPPKSNLQSRFVNSIPTRGWKARPCFYYHLRLCPGACVGQINSKDYKKIINRFVKFMEGKKWELQDELNAEMNKKSKNLEFEEALGLKRVIDGINYVTSSNKVEGYLENPNFLELQNQRSLEELKEILNLKDLPLRIEAYDISNIQGKNATGSLVVLTNGEIDKTQYRRFKIHVLDRPNDYAMHQEMMQRRLAHLEWPLPQLIIIDGGRGQVRVAEKQLNKLGLTIPTFGLAKRLEWLYPPEGMVIKLPRKSSALKLLQKIRDEAHRFALSYHKKLRSRSFLT